MKSVLWIFLGMLLLVGLVSAPVLAGVPAIHAGSDISSTGVATVRCQHATQKQGAVQMREASAGKAHCTCLIDHCHSMDDGSCQHSPVSSFTALLADSIKFLAMVHDHLVTIFQDSHTGLSVPPESPPPIV